MIENQALRWCDAHLVEMLEELEQKLGRDGVIKAIEKLIERPKLERRCVNCEFFYESVSGFDQECRRYPPVVERGWPVANRDWGCGEFRGRE